MIALSSHAVWTPEIDTFIDVEQVEDRVGPKRNTTRLNSVAIMLMHISLTCLYFLLTFDKAWMENINWSSFLYAAKRLLKQFFLVLSLMRKGMPRERIVTLVKVGAITPFSVDNIDDYLSTFEAPMESLKSPSPLYGATHLRYPLKRSITHVNFETIILENFVAIICFSVAVLKTSVLWDVGSVSLEFILVSPVYTAVLCRCVKQAIFALPSLYTAASVISMFSLKTTSSGCSLLEGGSKKVAYLCSLLPMLVKCFRRVRVRVAIMAQYLAPTTEFQIPPIIIIKLFLFLIVLFSSFCQAGQIYKPVGDPVVLNPADPIYKPVGDSFVWNPDLFNTITPLILNLGNYMVVKCDRDKCECYRGLVGRCSWNETDGSLTISNLTVEDNKVFNQLKLRVLERVPKPTVSVKCNNEKTLCNLICEAIISPNVGLVTYRWRSEEVVLSNDKELIIRTENEENSFICELKNRVSNSSSDEAANPISRGNPAAWVGLAVGIPSLIVAVAAVVAVAGCFVYYKRRQGKIPTWKEFWCWNDKGTQITDDDAESGKDLETSTLDGQKPDGGLSTETVQIIDENENEASSRNNEEKDALNYSTSSDETKGDWLADDQETHDEIEDSPVNP